MTRDEAIQIVSEHKMCGPARYVDTFVKLGMLKLDESKPADMEPANSLDPRIRFGKALQRQGVGTRARADIFSALEDAGLTVVDVDDQK